MKNVILITGASSGFGALAARALARAGHIVYASMRDIAGRNAAQAAATVAYATEHEMAIYPLELDVTSDASAAAAVAEILRREGRLDVVVHNAGHMVFGPAEAFTAEQYAQLYDVNVLGTQRLNRVALPVLRKQGQGLLIWISSSSVRGGTPPYLAPYFAPKAAMDSLAVSYAGELARWGVETSIVVPGAFTKGTNHFKHAGAPADRERAQEYELGPTKDLPTVALQGLASLEPPDADVAQVADAIVDVVSRPFGRRPFRVHVDPAQDGAEIVSGVADRVRAELLRRIGLQDLLTARSTATPSRDRQAKE